MKNVSVRDFLVNYVSGHIYIFFQVGSQLQIVLLATKKKSQVGYVETNDFVKQEKMFQVNRLEFKHVYKE